MTEVTKIARAIQANFKVSSFAYNEWSYVLSEEQPLEIVFQPEFWRGVGEKVMGHDGKGGFMDFIHVRKPDTAEYTKLMITGAGKDFIKVRKVELSVGKEVTISEESPLVTKWNVGKRCHDVVRKVNGAVMQTGFQTKDKAADWITEHLREMAA